MKKFCRVSLIIAGILAAAGIVFCGISLLFGGYRTIKNTAKSIEVIQKMKEFADRTGIQFSFPEEGFGLNITSAKDGYTEEVIHGSKTISFLSDEVQGMDISVGAGTFEIKEGTDTEQIKVTFCGIGNIDCDVENGVLHLDVFDHPAVVLGTGKANEVSCTVEFPAGYHAKQMAIEMGAGTVHVEELHADDLSVTMGAGQTICRKVQAANAEFEVAAGECLYEGEILSEMEIQCAVGQVVAQLAGKETDYNYEIDCSMGNVKIGSTNFAGLAGSKEVNYGADKSVDIECDMGNVEVKFEKEQ